MGVGPLPGHGLLIVQRALNVLGPRRGAGGQIVAGVLHCPGIIQKLEFQLCLVLKLLYRVLGVGPVLTAGKGGKAPRIVRRPPFQVVHRAGVVVAPHGGGKGPQRQGQHQQHHTHAVDQPAPADAPDFHFISHNDLFRHLSASPPRSWALILPRTPPASAAPLIPIAPHRIHIRRLRGVVPQRRNLRGPRLFLLLGRNQSALRQGFGPWPKRLYALTRALLRRVRTTPQDSSGLSCPTCTHNPTPYSHTSASWGCPQS